MTEADHIVAVKRRLVAVGAVLVAGCLVAAGTSYGSEPERFAPVHRPGPALTVSDHLLDNSLSCHGDVDGSPRTPVLMLQGGGVSADTSRWNYQKAFAQQRIPFCVLDIPDFGAADYQISAEYVVHAIRRVHDMRGSKIDLFSQSQGGPTGRWALRFWPDARSMVDDFVLLVPPNRGTSTAVLIGACAGGSSIRLHPPTDCAPAGWQGRPGSNWLRALNSRQETFPEISYTNVSSHYDEFVLAPNDLRGGGENVRNIAVQDICPLDTSEHDQTAMTDPVAYALTMDALSHSGPAEPARIGRSVCTRPFAPEIDPVTLPVNMAKVNAELAYRLLTSPAPLTPSEPPPRCYALEAGCAGD